MTHSNLKKENVFLIRFFFQVETSTTREGLSGLKHPLASESGDTRQQVCERILAVRA